MVIKTTRIQNVNKSREELAKTLMAGLRSQSAEEFALKEIVSRFLDKAKEKKKISLFP